MMKKIPLTAFLMILAAGLSFGQDGRYQLTLFGGAQYVMEYGSVDDYALGSNDFPVTPAHAPLSFGAAFLLKLNGRLGLELRGEYNASSSLSLSDPWDGDTVSIPSAKHLAGSLNLRWELSSGRMRPFLTLGGGVDKITGGTVTALSAYGYTVSFSPPDKTLSLFAQAGGGLRLALTPSLGLELDLRYRLLLGKPDLIHGLVAGAGLVWAF